MAKPTREEMNDTLLAIAALFDQIHPDFLNDEGVAFVVAISNGDRTLVYDKWVGQEQALQAMSDATGAVAAPTNQNVSVH